MNRVLAWLVAVSVGGAMLAGNAVAAVIDTTSSNNSSIPVFGEPDTTSYGQTFRAPNAVETSLDSFSFFLENRGGSAQPLKGYIMAWNEALGQTTGPVLFTSSLQTLPVGSGFIEIAIATGGLTLVASQDYVAFLSAAGLFDTVPDASQWQSVYGSDPYPDGHFVFHNSNGTFPGPGIKWDCGINCSWEGLGSDLSFKMSFSDGGQVPVPGTVALLGLGLLCICGVRRQR